MTKVRQVHPATMHQTKHASPTVCSLVGASTNQCMWGPRRKRTCPFLSQGAVWNLHPIQPYTTLKGKVKVTQSCLILCDPIDYRVYGIFQARILEWVAFPFSRGSSLGWNPGLWNYRQILYQLSHKGSPRILEWVAYPFSRGSSQPRTLLRFTFFLI